MMMINSWFRPRFRVEESAVLVGARYGRYWIARHRRLTTGEYSCVAADATWAFHREEARGDVVGFFHTHPPRAGTQPSATDRATMQTWVDSFGKPLLCVIQCGRATRATLFRAWDDPGVPMRRVVWIDRHTLVAVW